jgi:hypothetical protein
MNAEGGEAFAIDVHCVAGHRGEQTPHAFVLGGTRVEVAEILDQWLAPDHRYFKMRGADGDIYLVRHDTTADRWELTLYQRSARPEE